MNVTTANKLAAIAGARDDIRAAISAKDVDPGTDIRDYAGAITSLPEGLMFGVTLDDPSDLSSVNTVVIPEGVTTVPDGWFFELGGLAAIYGSFTFHVKGVSLPSTLTTIESNAFNGWSSATSLVIPDSVTSIGSSAFEGWSSAASLVIPGSVTSIGDGAFAGWSSAASLVIPESVTSIDLYTFRGWTSAETITVHATTPPTITSYSFQLLASGAQFYVPAGSINAYETAQYWSDFAGRYHPIT